MKSSLKKFGTRGKWFSVETTGAFSGGIGNFAFVAGKAGFARRNPKQPLYVQLIAPIGAEARFINGWHLSERDAEYLIKLIAPAPEENDCSEVWNNIWKNLMAKADIRNLKL